MQTGGAGGATEEKDAMPNQRPHRNKKSHQQNTLRPEADDLP